MRWKQLTGDRTRWNSRIRCSWRDARTFIAHWNDIALSYLTHKFPIKRCCRVKCNLPPTRPCSISHLQYLKAIMGILLLLLQINFAPCSAGIRKVEKVIGGLDCDRNHRISAYARRFFANKSTDFELRCAVKFRFHYWMQINWKHTNFILKQRVSSSPALEQWDHSKRRPYGRIR